MTPAQAELLSRYRRLIVELQREIENMNSGGFSIRSNGEDVTASIVHQWQERIKALEDLVAKHDPEGFTVLR